MRHSTTAFFVVAICLALTGCPATNPPRLNTDAGTNPSTTSNMPNVKDVAVTLPQFAKKENEVEIANSFNAVDPSWVIGSLVNIKTGKVRALDSYLKNGAKLITTPQSEIAFKKFIENAVAVDATWLDFVKAKVDDKTRAEVTVAENSRVTTDNTSIDKATLITELAKIPSSARSDYGVIIGYIDYLLSASYFRNEGAEGTISGFGAKIGGLWYSKYEDSGVHHRIVAIWAPLPFVLDTIESQQTKDLSKATTEAINSGVLKIQKIETMINIQ